MKCLETRRRGGIKWRRYRTEEGAIIRTGEVPMEVLSELGPKRLAEALERAKRTEHRLRRKARAENLLREGWKPAAVAAEVGLSEAMVRRYRQHMRDKPCTKSPRSSS